MQEIEGSNFWKKDNGSLIHFPCERRKAEDQWKKTKARLHLCKEPQAQEQLENCKWLQTRFTASLLNSGIFIHPPVVFGGKKIWIIDKHGEYLRSFESPREIMKAIFLGEL